MGLVYKLKDQYKILSIVGMAKNSGKTTALNYIIEEAYDEDMIIGLTSSGRDGESQDVVTGTEKPKIFAFEGTVVSIPVQLYELADAGLEILKRTHYSTPLGDILICRVRESGYVQIAGPLNVKDHKEMCGQMLSMGLDMLLIDGAIDRKSIANPDISDGIILATGAVLSRNMRKVIEQTVHVVNLFKTDEVQNTQVRQTIKDRQDKEKILLFNMHDQKLQIRELDLKTGLGAGQFLDDVITENTSYVYLPGALTLSAISDIHPAKYKNTKFIVKDPTKIFIEALPWRQLAKKAFKVETLQRINITSITVNPYSPLGWAFDHRELRDEMRNAIPDIPIIDVRQEES